MAKISLLARLLRTQIESIDRIPIVDQSAGTTKYVRYGDLLLSNRNRIHNGGFQVNLRGVSGSVVLAAGAYGHDRWKAGAAGCTYTFASLDGVVTVTITAGSLVQVIEGLDLQTGTHVLSWVGTAQGKIGAGSFGNSGLTGAVTGGANLAIEFGTGTLAMVQFEPGAIVTPFDWRGVRQELADCQRFFETGITFLQSAGAGVFGLRMRFREVKRAVPAIIITPTASVAFSGGAVQGFDTDGFGYNGTATAAGGYAFINWSASADL